MTPTSPDDTPSVLARYPTSEPVLNALPTQAEASRKDGKEDGKEDGKDTGKKMGATPKADDAAPKKKKKP